MNHRDIDKRNKLAFNYGGTATGQRIQSAPDTPSSPANQLEQFRTYATRTYWQPTYLRWMAAYSVPDFLSTCARLMVMDDFGTLVQGGYCYFLQGEPEPLEIEFRTIGFAEIGADTETGAE